MVSFQCDACTDVVKKPKLDRHYGQCRSSFTCIDCSKTFPGPAEWKAHTSCVTEAEKYQKSLYKGPKKGQRLGNGHQKNSQPENVNATGKYHQSRNNQSGWSRQQYIRNCASGANNTPLGSPRRMSPMDPSAVEPSPSMANALAKIESGVSKKRDLVADHVSNGSEPKEKKRKKEHDPPKEQTENDAAADESTNPVVEPFKKEPSDVKRSSEKQKTSKGSREHGVSQSPTEGVKVKKRKKEKREEVQLEQEDVKEQPIADDDKKRKRKHKEKREDSQGNEGEEAAKTERVEEKKRKKKRKLTG